MKAPALSVAFLWIFFLLSSCQNNIPANNASVDYFGIPGANLEEYIPVISQSIVNNMLQINVEETPGLVFYIRLSRESDAFRVGVRFEYFSKVDLHNEDIIVSLSDSQGVPFEQISPYLIELFSLTGPPVYRGAALFRPSNNILIKRPLIVKIKAKLNQKEYLFLAKFKSTKDEPVPVPDNSK